MCQNNAHDWHDRGTGVGERQGGERGAIQRGVARSLRRRRICKGCPCVPFDPISGVPSMLSARNQFPGKIKSVKLGNVMAEVVIEVDSIELVSVITRHSAEQLKLKVGDEVTAVIKSTEVLVSKG